MSEKLKALKANVWVIRLRGVLIRKINRALAGIMWVGPASGGPLLVSSSAEDLPIVLIHAVL